MGNDNEAAKISVGYVDFAFTQVRGNICNGFILAKVIAEFSMYFNEDVLGWNELVQQVQ